MFKLSQFTVEPSGRYFVVFFHGGDTPAAIANTLTLEQAAKFVRALCDERA